MKRISSDTGKETMTMTMSRGAPAPGSDGADLLAYSTINPVGGEQKINIIELDSEAFPRSPPPTKGHSYSTRGANPRLSLSSLATNSSSEIEIGNGNGNSINENETRRPVGHIQNIIAAIPYRSRELDRAGNNNTTNKNNKKPINNNNKYDVFKPVKEHKPVPAAITTKSKSHSNKSKKSSGGGGGGGWEGIGFDGEKMTLSVCSEFESHYTPTIAESSMGTETMGPSVSASAQEQQQQEQQQQQSIPKAIDFSRFEFENLPMVDEDKISVVSHDHLDHPHDESFYEHKPFAQKVLHDIDELSVDLSVLEDIDSITSVMTKEGAIDLAKRLEKMERQLLELAGQTSKTDALKALARATNEQSKRADKLQRRVRKQEKKISTLNDLCQRLLDRKRQDSAHRSSSKREIEELKNSKSELILELHRSEARNEELNSKLQKMSEKMHTLEDTNNQKSKLLLANYSEKNAYSQLQSKYNTLRDESHWQTVGDRARIRQLETEIWETKRAHAKKEQKSKNKIGILVDMKSAMEEQIRLLEGDLNEDDNSTL